jgi:hypothetical protein
MSAPTWMTKYPCTYCETGYGFCAEGLRHSLMCCANCDHPGRWVENPWTADEIVEMWEGREMPEGVKQGLAHLRGGDS